MILLPSLDFETLLVTQKFLCVCDVEHSQQLQSGPLQDHASSKVGLTTRPSLTPKMLRRLKKESRRILFQTKQPQ